ncbi:hypothetical protein HPQ64_08325 [Rhizobiales bacterium]|uniref:hypothetical protein n=1 Tax=Hongsoonwoonella zoysiae TaxID=2821844 RepID=UPI0015608CCE|nr:hypothetical protein [Hongsoonwoonella zoysiae]NRG17692.1 hypothetical protein [Hongsoonwoonella zoysiae]
MQHFRLSALKLSLALAVSLTTFASAASASDWETVSDTAFTRVLETNSTMVALAVQCADEMKLEIYAANDGPIFHADTGETSEFQYLPGKVLAVIDGEAFPLAAAGAEATTVLFSEGREAQNYLAPISPPLAAALRSGNSLELRFDLLPEAAPDGSPFETYGRFSLNGAAEAMDTTGPYCR